MKKSKVISCIYLTGSTIFDTDWNANGIVACSENCSVYFIGYKKSEINDKHELNLTKVVTFECAIRTVQWNILNKDLLAAGTFTGFIYIINSNTYSIE